MSVLTSVVAGTLRIKGLPARWLQRIETRERLAAMPERLLVDIALDPAAVAREVRRPFWRRFGDCLQAGPPPSRPAASSGAPVPMPTMLGPAARLWSATFPTLS